MKWFRHWHRKQLGRGPRIVAIGGGTGLSVLLRGLKERTTNITAIVTVSDDGGSSGRLRRELGILPPGDIRNCLVALADTEPLVEKLFQYRFDQGDGLAGHSFGNLFIAAMTAVTGDFEEAVRQSSAVLAVRGRVLPSTLGHVVLCAQHTDGSVTRGESEIVASGRPIARVWLDPDDAPPTEEALAAIMEADLVVMGPGSLYSSILPNLAVRGLLDAIKRTLAAKVFICNVMTQPGETVGYSASDHLKALIDHAGPGAVDYMVVNTKAIPPEVRARYDLQGAKPVAVDDEMLSQFKVRLVKRELATYNDVVRHHPGKLADVLMELVRCRRGRYA